MIGLTQRQSELLQFLRAHFAAHGCGPSYNEIRLAMGWSSVGATRFAIQSLAARGYIAVTPYITRGIKLVEAEGHNPAHCFCAGCNRVRVRTAQTFIQALHEPAPILAGSNFKAVNGFDRTCWRIGFPKAAHPETRKPQSKMQPAKVGQ